MVSFRFPFSFSQPPKPKPINSTASNFSIRSFSAACSVAFVAGGAGIAAAGIALSQNSSTKPSLLDNALNYLISPRPWLNRNSFSPTFGSMSLSDSSAPVTEPTTGMSFPSVLNDTQRLLGVGLRKKSILGLKNIRVYAFGTTFDLCSI